MPDQPPKARAVIWRLSSAAACGQLLWVDCGYCHDRHGRRYYEPSDLIRLFGDADVNKLARRMRCEHCGRNDNIEVDVILPVAAERVRMTVRRLAEIRVKRTPIWRDVIG
ncbi:MAG: hypothetical protein E5W74_09170 [Mesorhizobium sp.]|nr:MAG: hypothetical protein E5W74_09170 [Mesorhizobium sp.]